MTVASFECPDCGLIISRVEFPETRTWPEVRAYQDKLSRALHAERCPGERLPLYKQALAQSSFRHPMDAVTCLATLRR